MIGEGISLEKIPAWLKRSLIKKESSPSPIAREIYDFLKVAAENYQQPIFLGRNKERELIEDVTNPLDGRKRPNCFGIFGLPGIGRRSLIGSCVNDLFSLSRIIEIEIEAGDNGNTLCIKLADKIEPYSCQEELKDIVESIKALSETEALQRALLNIEKLVLSGELPLLIDVGGALNDNGTFKSFLNKLIIYSEDYKNSYFIFILTRRVSRDNEVNIEFVPVQQLNKKAISQLLMKLADKYKFGIESEQISELSDYIDGYPPSANYAAKQASLYGVPALIKDKRQLVQFSKKRFVSHIKEQKLSNEDETVLKVLSEFSPLPLESLLALFQDKYPYNVIYAYLILVFVWK